MPNVKSYSQLGGYPLFYYVKSDDGHLHTCASCINQNRVGKNVEKIQGHVNWEDIYLACDVCQKEISPTYED
jgi:hypothetical protein